MKSINLTSRDFDAFLALADTRHFTRAAELCHLSQSAFSQKISRIEQIAGISLFERSTRHVSLTPEGEAFAEEVRRIKGDLLSALTRLNARATHKIGKVSVAALPSVAANWMPKIITNFRTLYPGIEIHLYDTLAENALDMLREERVDMAITAGGDVLEFNFHELKVESFYLICPIGHHLARKKMVALEDLRDENFIQLARSSSVRQHLEKTGMSAKAGGLEVEHLATVAALVEQGLGVSIIPELTLFHFSSNGLARVPIPKKDIERPILLALKKGKALSSAARAMIEQIKLAAKTL